MSTSFRKMDETQAEFLLESLSLSMSKETLLSCRDHFREQEKREPDEEELRLFDGLNRLPADETDFSVSQLYTDDEEIAKTYQDMMHKHFDLHGPLVERPTLSGALHLANEYLVRVGKKAVVPPLTLFDRAKLSEEELINAVCTEDSEVCLCKRESTKAWEAGDCLLLVMQGNSEERLFSENEDIFLSETLKEKIKTVFEIPQTGILPLLLKETDGVFLDLNSLQNADVSFDLSALIHRFAGGKILVLSNKNMESAKKFLQEYAFEVLVLGCLTLDGSFRYVLGETERSLQFSFLRRLLPKRWLIAKTGEVWNGSVMIPKRILFTHSPSSCQNTAESVRFFDTAVNAVYGSLKDLPYRNAVRAALWAAIPALLSGSSKENAGIAVSLTLPNPESDPRLAGDALSAVLGVYRVQTELSVFASSLCVRFSDRLKAPEITAFGMMPDADVPNTLSAEGSTIYCTSFPFVNRNLPDFDKIRKFLKDASSLAKNGELLSAHPFFDLSMTEAVLNLSSNGLKTEFLPRIIVNNGKIPFGILFESNRSDLPFEKAATVVKRA